MDGDGAIPGGSLERLITMSLVSETLGMILLSVDHISGPATSHQVMKSGRSNFIHLVIKIEWSI